MRTALTSFGLGPFAALFLALGHGSEPGMIDPVASGDGIELALASGGYSAWSAPVNLGEVINSSANDQGPGISKDGRSLYFTSTRPGGCGRNDLWVSRRAKHKGPWGLPVNLGPVINTSGVESTPTLSQDGRRLYFASGRPGGVGNSIDIWVSERLDKRDDLSWQAPVNLGRAINSAAAELGPTFFVDSKTGAPVMYFYSTRSGGLGCRDLYSSTFGENGEFGPAVPLTELNTPGEDEQPAIRRDGLEIFFVSNRPAGAPCQGAGNPGGEIYVSTRASTSDPWGPPVNLGPPINTSGAEGRPALSWDGRSLYFFSDGHGGEGSTDLFVSTRTKLEHDGDDDDDVEE